MFKRRLYEIFPRRLAGTTEKLKSRSIFFLKKITSYGVGEWKGCFFLFFLFLFDCLLLFFIGGRGGGASVRTVLKALKIRRFVEKYSADALTLRQHRASNFKNTN